MTSPTKRWSLTTTAYGQQSTTTKDWDFSPSSMWKIPSSILHLTVKQEAFSISGLVKICCQQSRDILRPHLGKPVWLVSARVPLLNVRLSLFFLSTWLPRPLANSTCWHELFDGRKVWVSWIFFMCKRLLIRNKLQACSAGSLWPLALETREGAWRCLVTSLSRDS